MLDKASLVGPNFFPDKNDYKSGGIFDGLFLAPEIKFSLINSEFGNLEEHKTFEAFHHSKRLINRSQGLKLIEGKKYQLCYLLPEKKPFSSGVLMPTKLRFYNECIGKIICDRCNIQIKKTKKCKLL